MAELQDYHKKKIKEIISDLSGHPLEAINEEIELKDGLGLDSLDIVEIVIQLENEFDCNIPNEDYENVKTVGDVLKDIENRV